ncbi:hypothetical protein ACFC1T_35765 [Kitasatospora sp. NPDC056076]|uniref:LppU/SCO3897 family protein n=1 Tax=Kitasatospora sp. NPDC056076 TaxID=3345703 RepID=UPI0035E1A9D7
MSPQGPPPGPDRPERGPRNVNLNLNATASGHGRVNQAGRDQHFHITVPLLGAALVLGLLLFALWKPIQQVAGGLVDSSPSPSVSAVVPWDRTTHLDTDPRPDPPTPRPAPRPTPTPTPTPTPMPTPTPTPTPPPLPPDPADVAFAAVRAGDCLDVYDTGWGTWSRTVPVAVDCRGGSAFNRVAVVATAAAGCPAGGGRAAYVHTNRDHSVTVLCLERQFRYGQCFLGHTPDHRTIDNGFLGVVWDCTLRQGPSTANAMLAITAVVTSRDNCPAHNGRYGAEWPVLDGTTKVCAVVV